MLFETTKQLTILSSGSIVVIGTFLSNIFPTDKHGILAIPNGIKLLIATAFVGFGGSLISATITMFFYPYRQILSQYGTGSVIGGLLHQLLTLALFVGGIICFGSAVLLNMFR